MKTLYLIDPSFDFFSINPDSVLLTNAPVELYNGCYHTSIHDCLSENILRRQFHFDQIRLFDQSFVRGSQVYKETLLLYSYLEQRKADITYQDKFLSNTNCQYRQHEKNLWVFGCSHSHGTGLEPHEKNYGTLLSEKLNLPLVSVTRPGSSVHWSARHLFSAAVKSQDIVIWQITAANRVTRFNGTHTEEVQLAQTKDRSILDAFTEPQIYFEHFSLIHYGVQYLRAIGCRFILIALINKHDIKDIEYLDRYAAYQEYLPISDCYVDHGNDGTHHPGPLSHQKMAERLFNNLTETHDKSIS